MGLYVIGQERGYSPSQSYHFWRTNQFSFRQSAKHFLVCISPISSSNADLFVLSAVALYSLAVGQFVVRQTPNHHVMSKRSSRDEECSITRRSFDQPMGVDDLLRRGSRFVYSISNQ